MLVAILIIIILGAASFIVYRTVQFKKEKEASIIKPDDPNVPYQQSQLEIELFDFVNNHRSSIGLNRLTNSAYISTLCMEHDLYMESKNSANHDLFDNRSARIIATLGAKSVGENVAYNYLSPMENMDAWLKSPGHKANIENPLWTIMGLSWHGKYVTNIFAEIKK
jgi:uncharacterized protein YkwD